MGLAQQRGDVGATGHKGQQTQCDVLEVVAGDGVRAQEEGGLFSPCDWKKVGGLLGQMSTLECGWWSHRITETENILSFGSRKIWVQIQPCGHSKWVSADLQ